MSIFTLFFIPRRDSQQQQPSRLSHRRSQRHSKRPQKSRSHPQPRPQSRSRPQAPQPIRPPNSNPPNNPHMVYTSFVSLGKSFALLHYMLVVGSFGIATSRLDASCFCESFPQSDVGSSIYNLRSAIAINPDATMLKKSPHASTSFASNPALNSIANNAAIDSNFSPGRHFRLQPLFI